jgi:hypothetical protein
MKLPPRHGPPEPTRTGRVRRDHKIAAATAALAIAVPAGAATWIGARTDDLADRIGERGGIHARIGGVDADLTGTIRLTDVALGDLFAAESVEASVALDSLLAGHVAADEIRVAGPRIAVQVDRDGDSDLARLVRRLGRREPGTPGGGSSRVRRIVVTSGTLIARVAGIGELAADDVELVPDGHGVRLITGKLRVRAGNAQLHGEIDLARSAADISLPHVSFGRVLAVAGTGTIEIGGRTVTLRDIAIGRLTPGGSLEARGFLDDGGIPRAVGAELVPPAGDRGFALSLQGDRIPLAPLAPLAPPGLVLDGAHASGQLTVTRGSRANHTVQVAAQGSLTGVRLDHKTLAPQPLSIDTTLDTVLAISPEAIVVDHATMSIGAAQWTTSGWLRRGSPLSGQLDVRLAAAPCDALFASIPIEVRGPLDGLALTGTFAGRARLSIDLAAPAGEGVELDTSLAHDCTVTAEPPAADVGTLAERPADDRPWIALKKLPWFVPGAFVSAEDGQFYEHAGFDLTQIARSLEIDLRDRRLARGGSTISQQLVKNELLTHRRSLDRKIQEALLTWRLEERLEKRQILERYLNIIELGPKVHGIVAAARYWFDETAGDLSIREAAFLAALTSEPQSMSRRVRHAGGLDPESAARVDTVLRAMRRDGVISKEEHEAARDKPLRFASTALRREI